MKRTFKIVLILISLGFVQGPLVNSVYAQFYRPSYLKWYQLKTPHFKIIFSTGEDSVAHAAGRILESQYQTTQQLTGGHLHNFPVILNGYTDYANGFVTSNVFRMEVDIATMKGKAMNPQTGGWLENVFPHELTHALHLSVTPWPGVSSIIRPFSPDYARSVNYNALMGFHEGLAVYRETHVRPKYGGRGNYPFFDNQFRSNLMSSKNWSLGQLFSLAGDNRPFDRHYIGGYQFVNWLENNYGKDIARKIINFDSRWPFLGLGGAVWHQTGKLPIHLYDKFEKDKRLKEKAREDSIKSLGKDPYSVISLPFKGPSVHRPKWIGKEKILFYGSFYNKRPGFWIYNTKTHHISKFLETLSVQNYWYDINLKKHEMLYANYRPSPFFDSDYKADIYKVNLNTGDSKRLTNRKRVFSPVFNGKKIWALQTDHESTRWIKVEKGGNIKPVFSVRPDKLIAIEPNPVDTGLTAVVANRNGVQALWLVQSGDKSKVLNNNPDIAFKHASIFDPSWNKNGSKLLFTSDYGGVMNLYQYDMERESVTQITNTLFNCYEGSYSEDGNSIAFVVQQGDYHELAVIHKSDYLNRFISRDIWHANVTHRMNAPRLASGLTDSSKTWKVKRFHSGLNWLKPRTILPYALNSSFTGTRWGAVFTSSDLLLRNSYNIELSTSNQRLWYNATYRYSGFYPGFEVSAFDEPLENVYVLNTTNNNKIYYGEEKQGFSFGIPIPITLKQNARYSSIFIRPEIKTFRARPITTSGKYFTGNNWKGRFSGNLFISYKAGLQQDIQDAQPNTGTVFYAEGEQDFTNHLSDSRKALRAGIYTYLSPLRRYNQSLRLGLLVQTQTKIPVFNTSDLISSGFNDNILAGLNNVASFSSRYAIPIINPDNGGFLLPLYIQQVYGVLFTNTATNLDNNSLNNIINHSRTVYGIGLHFVTGLSNLRIDLGFGLAYEPTRNKINGIIGIL